MKVAHRVVERQLLPNGDRLAGDEVEGLPVVEPDTAVGIAGVVDLWAEAAVERPTVGTDLCRVRVVACQRPDQEADHDGLAGRERACGHHPIALAVGRAVQLDAFPLGNLGAARLALREDRRSGTTRRGGAGRPGGTNVGQGNPFRLTPSEDERSSGPSEPPVPTHNSISMPKQSAAQALLHGDAAARGVVVGGV